MIDTLAGKLLVAMPGIGDPRFERSVIMMCAHDGEHAMGVIINKPKDELTLSDVLDHLGLEPEEHIADRIVLDGGPVRQDRGFVLHSEDFAAGEGTQDVCPGIRLTATREVLEAVAGDQAPERFLLALGCAGWSAGQLEAEMESGSWIVVSANRQLVFETDNEMKWSLAIASLGFDVGNFSTAVGHA